MKWIIGSVAVVVAFALYWWWATYRLTIPAPGGVRVAPGNLPTGGGDFYHPSVSGGQPPVVGGSSGWVDPSVASSGSGSSVHPVALVGGSSAQPATLGGAAVVGVSGSSFFRPRLMTY